MSLREWMEGHPGGIPGYAETATFKSLTGAGQLSGLDSLASVVGEEKAFEALLLAAALRFLRGEEASLPFPAYRERQLVWCPDREDWVPSGL